MAEYEPNIAPEHRPDRPTPEPIFTTPVPSVSVTPLTERQRKLGEIVAEAFINGEVLTDKALAQEAGYAGGASVATLPDKKLAESLKLAMFSVDNAQEIVGEIMANPDNSAADRLKAADMVFKSFGSYAPEKKITLDIKSNANVSPELEKVRLKYEAELRLQLASGKQEDK